MKYWWLVENFTAEGHSTGLYMACQVNMTITADVNAARKFRLRRTAEFRALDMRDARCGNWRGDWRAVEHGFDDSKTPNAELSRCHGNGGAMDNERTPGALDSNDGLGPLPEDALRQCVEALELHNEYPGSIWPFQIKATRNAAITAARAALDARQPEPVGEWRVAPEQRALTADVFEALDLSPEQFLTDGGLVNRGKLRAAFLHPHDYLPEGHWMRAADSQSPMAEALRDLLAAHAMRASCQAGLVERCKCVPCATARARKALAPNVELTGRAGLPELSGRTQG